MEWFSNLAQHSAERYRALTVPARVAGLVLAATLLAGVLLLAVGHSGPYQPLFDGRSFSLRELARMTAAFQSAGLRDARLADGRILVPRAKLDAYLVALDAADALPADFDDSLDRIAAETSPFASRQQTELGYRVAEQKRLARILSGMNGIETASVQYAEVKRPGFPPVLDIRAVVAVRADGNRELAYEEIEAIRDTVTGFVAGLDRTQVTVSDLNACRAYPGSDDPGSAVASYAARTEQARLEEFFREKIRERLAAYPGLIVGVHVQLADRDETTNQAVVPATRRRLVPELVSASIDLPRSYFVQIWRDRHAHQNRLPDRPDLEAIEREVKDTVEQAVLALLPPPAAELGGRRQVVVTSYEDPVAPDRTGIAGLGSRTAARGAMLWFLVVGGGLAIGWLMWSVRKRGAQAAVEEDVEQIAPSEAADDAPTVRLGATVCDAPETEREIQFQVQRAVQENPQAAAEALQRWLRKAA